MTNDEGKAAPRGGLAPLVIGLYFVIRHSFVIGGSLVGHSSFPSRWVIRHSELVGKESLILAAIDTTTSNASVTHKSRASVIASSGCTTGE
jgi:hypothetical protein